MISQKQLLRRQAFLLLMLLLMTAKCIQEPTHKRQSLTLKNEQHNGQKEQHNGQDKSSDNDSQGPFPLSKQDQARRKKQQKMFKEMKLPNLQGLQQFEEFHKNLLEQKKSAIQKIQKSQLQIAPEREETSSIQSTFKIRFYKQPHQQPRPQVRFFEKVYGELRYDFDEHLIDIPENYMIREKTHRDGSGQQDEEYTYYFFIDGWFHRYKGNQQKVHKWYQFLYGQTKTMGAHVFFMPSATHDGE